MKKVLYLATEDWFFASHFLPMARAARALGMDAVLATQIGHQRPHIEAEGIRLISLPTRRASFGAAEVAGYVRRASAIIRAERPDIVHCIALRPVVLGGLAAALSGVSALVLAPTGLGHLWISDAVRDRWARSLVRWIAGQWLRGPRTRYLFENEDDPRAFGLAPDDPQVSVIGGAGVDPALFPITLEPAAPPVRFAVVSRMIEAKGIADAVNAVRWARAAGAPVELSLFGEPDQSTRQAIPEATLRAWSDEPGIRWHGATDDVAGVWRSHHAALFLSRYREGLPRTILEAAASGRPIIASDIPGCRAFVRDGREGLLVPCGDSAAAVRAIATLAGDPSLRRRMGEAARRRVDQGFTINDVSAVVSGVYQSLIAPRDRI